MAEYLGQKEPLGALGRPTGGLTSWRGEMSKVGHSHLETAPWGPDLAGPWSAEKGPMWTLMVPLTLRRVKSPAGPVCRSGTAWR